MNLSDLHYGSYYGKHRGLSGYFATLDEAKADCERGKDGAVMSIAGQMIAIRVDGVWHEDIVFSGGKYRPAQEVK